MEKQLQYATCYLCPLNVEFGELVELSSFINLLQYSFQSQWSTQFALQNNDAFQPRFSYTKFKDT